MARVSLTKLDARPSPTDFRGGRDFPERIMPGPLRLDATPICPPAAARINKPSRPSNACPRGSIRARNPEALSGPA